MELRGKGDEVILRKCFKKVSTPKLVKAEPKNTGVSVPALTSSILNSALAPSKSSTSSINLSLKWVPISPISSSESMWRSRSATSFCPFIAAVNVDTILVFLSYTPLNSLPEPIGQLIGHVLMPRILSISSQSSKGSLASLSILLIKVKIGIWRITQTLKSLIVCFSTPLEPSITITGSHECTVGIL